MIRNRLKAVSSAIAAFTLLIGVSGCGPGMPFMTAEEQKLVSNVDMLVKENEAMKARLAALENAGAGDHLKTQKDIDGLKLALADAKNSVEQVRQEFSFVKGSMEETSFAKAQTREDLKNMNASVKALNSKLSSIDAGIKEANSRLDALDKKTAALYDAAVLTDRRVAELETKAAKEKETATKKTEDAQTLYQKGKDAAGHKDYQAAIDAFSQLLSEFPKHKLAGSAQYWLGDSYFMKGDYERAVVELDKVVKNHADSNKAASAILKQALSFEKLGSRKDAKALYKKVIEKYPKSAEAASAKKRLKTLKGK